MKVAETRINKKNMTTVPRAVREALELRVGDVIEWHIENERIVVRKKRR